jgi:hypothetical protein
MAPISRLNPIALCQNFEIGEFAFQKYATWNMDWLRTSAPQNRPDICWTCMAGGFQP